MDFRLTDEQIMLSDTVSAMLFETCASARLRAQLETDAPSDAERWAAIVELGLPGLMAPERAGGVALGALEMALVAVACGGANLPEPLVEHAGVAVPMLADAHAEALADAVDGKIVAVGHPTNPRVANADAAAALLLTYGDEVHLVKRADVGLAREASFDPFRRLFRVQWTPTTATRLVAGARARALWDEAFERGALFSAAQALGVAQRAVTLAVAYASERRQFGKAIGAFQAIKHVLANVQVKIEFARPLLYAAATALDAMAPAAPMRISHAKLACCSAADAAVHAALQVHGAMGYSWDTDVHLYLKRSLALANAWGTLSLHRARVAKHALSHLLGPGQTFAGAEEAEGALESA